MSLNEVYERLYTTIPGIEKLLLSEIEQLIRTLKLLHEKKIGKIEEVKKNWYNNVNSEE